MRIERKLEFGPVTGLRMGYAPIGKPLMSVICYQVDNILIDTGAKNVRQSLLKLLDRSRLEGVYLTHYHEDHAGNAAHLNKALGLPVFGHPLTQAMLSQKLKLKPYELYMWGQLEPAEVKPIEEHFHSENYDFTIVHTPGHSHDHVVFLEENQGWLFSGDMYLGAKIRYFRRDENIYETIESLKRIAALDFDKLFCGHNPQMRHPKRFIKRKIDYLENIFGQVAHLYALGVPKNAIIKQLLKNKESWLAKAITLGDVSYKNMLESSFNSVSSGRGNK